jgi:hypothetical protein
MAFMASNVEILILFKKNENKKNLVNNMSSIVKIKVATGSSSFGFGSVWVGFGLGLVSNFEKHLVMVWFWFLRQSFSLVLVCYDRTKKLFFKNFATFF